MKCPICKLINPDTAQRCDCGYDFGTKTVENSYLPQKLQKRQDKTLRNIIIASILSLVVLVLLAPRTTGALLEPPVMSYVVPLLPVLIAIKVAVDRRPLCDWPLPKSKHQMWFAISLIALSQLLVFANPKAQPFSPMALIEFFLEVFGVYRLTRAILRKRDLAKMIPSPAIAE